MNPVVNIISNWIFIFHGNLVVLLNELLLKLLNVIMSIKGINISERQLYGLTEEVKVVEGI